MRLVVKQSGNLVKEYHFDNGPVYIGRQMTNQVHLPDVATSRQHAVIVGPHDGTWFIEDLDSANKTFLNGNAIHKEELKEGDTIAIADFAIEVFIEEPAEKPNDQAMVDTLMTVIHAPDKIIRRYTEHDSPAIKMDKTRAAHFGQATAEIYGATDKQNLLETITNLVFKQFNPFHVWISFGPAPDSPEAVSIGRKKTGQSMNLSDYMFHKDIEESVKKKKYTLLPMVSRDNNPQRIRSAIIAPILFNNEYLGVIYADNATKRTHYSLTDLDYLMLLAVQTGVKLQTL
ncbi:MAG: FHA domain-containing protein [Planctomycetes bacterium]|nr:FHA domain-containing protein [Planctomycetota bacterium]